MKTWVFTIVFAALVLLAYDAHVENRGLRQLVTDWLGVTTTDMRWQECFDAKRVVCN